MEAIWAICICLCCLAAIWAICIASAAWQPSASASAARQSSATASAGQQPSSSVSAVLLPPASASAIQLPLLASAAQQPEPTSGVLWQEFAVAASSSCSHRHLSKKIMGPPEQPCIAPAFSSPPIALGVQW